MAEPPEPSWEEFRELTPEPPPEERPRHKRRGGLSVRLTGGGILLLFVADLFVLSLVAWPILEARLHLPQPSLPPPTEPLPVSSSTPTPTDTTTPEPAPTLPLSPTASLIAPYPGQPAASLPGLVLLSLQEGRHTHLFAYQPQSIPLTRLTAGEWDDIDPAISPNGQQVAFASNRNGYWDLYLLDLTNGTTSRLTDSLDYEAAPSWSPDGLWLAYEAAITDDPGGLDLYIRPVAGDSEAVRLTDDSSADFSPAWSPQGRQIAFVSTRSGEPEIWLADLDKSGDDRFTNLSRNPLAEEAHPAWSPDGSRLAWSAVEDGHHTLLVWQPGQDRPTSVGAGDYPAWSPEGNILLASLVEPNKTYLVAYPLQAPGVLMPPYELPGSEEGLTWSAGQLSQPLPETFLNAAQLTPTPLWLPALSQETPAPSGRMTTVSLDDVEAPYPILSDLVDESFQALRTSIADTTGWDFLSSLENAFVPLTSSLDPGMQNDWLYTGRAFAFNTLPINANWIVVVREQFGSDTYWRVYLRARFQDGSAGEPLHAQPWNFNARLEGDTTAYEQGGALQASIPAGYWIDFTRYAAGFGWERMPALLTWKASYPAARFNEFVMKDGLDWSSAMLELYPPEALITPTPLIPPTRTLTPTPRWYQSPTPTLTPTPRPTWTPIPTEGGI